MGKKKMGLPDRWLHYLPLGKRIPGTRFIAFKVPLKKAFECKLDPNERFSPKDLVSQVREQKEELGLVIDLTCTTRYYDAQELPDTIQYCKIGTAGQRVPDKDTVFKFKNTVEKFLMENRYNDNLIGVHCTHGLNRTGYLICRYLIDVEGMDPNKAIELFNRCRGHCIERQNYIDSLHRRYDRRNPHHTTVSGCGWNRGHCGSAQNSEFQGGYHRTHPWPQYPVQTQSHSSFERSGGQTQPRKSSHTWNQSFVTSYSCAQPVYSPQYSPMASITQQRPGYHANPNYRLFSSPYQQQLRAHRPNFPVHNLHYSQQ